MRATLVTALVVLLVPSAILAQPDKAAVKICRMWYFEDEDGVTHADHRYGTGFVIWSGKDKDGDDVSYIVTNSHVAPEDNYYDIVSYNDGPKKPHLYRCQWVKANEDREKDGDLALLKCYHKFPSIKLAKNDPPKDADLVAWGFPKAGRLTKLGGKFLASTGPGGDDFVYGDYLAVPGCSGSAVCLNDELVAVSFGVSNKKDQFGRPLYQEDGKTPVICPPTWMVPRKKIEVFLNRAIPDEMGVKNEKGPVPSVFSRPTKPCDVR